MSNVIELGEFRVTQERSKRYFPNVCRHIHITLNPDGEIVECNDCHKQIGAFWALNMLMDEYVRAREKVSATSQRMQAEAKKDLHLNAAKRVEQVWRSRTMVPACPHCSVGILPEDGLGSTRINREMEIRRRQVAKETSNAK